MCFILWKYVHLENVHEVQSSQCVCLHSFENSSPFIIDFQWTQNRERWLYKLFLNSWGFYFVNCNPEGSWWFVKRNLPPCLVSWDDLYLVECLAMVWGVLDQLGIVINFCFSVFLSQLSAGPSSPVTLALYLKEGWLTCITFSNTQKSRTTTHP